MECNSHSQYVNDTADHIVLYVYFTPVRVKPIHMKVQMKHSGNAIKSLPFMDA